jgi:hypothetical protein
MTRARENAARRVRPKYGRGKCESWKCERDESCEQKSAPVIRQPPHRDTNYGEGLAGSGVPPSSDAGRTASRGAQTAIRPARPDSHSLRRGKGKIGLGKDIGRGTGLRRGLAILPQATRQKGLGHFGDPLLEQSADLFAQIGGVIQARKLEAFQRRVRRFAQIIPRRNDAAAPHDCIPPERVPIKRTISMFHNVVPDNSKVLTLGLWKFLQEALYARETDGHV